MDGWMDGWVGFVDRHVLGTVISFPTAFFGSACMKGSRRGLGRWVSTIRSGWYTLGLGLDVIFVFPILILSMYVCTYIHCSMYGTLPGIYNHTSSSCTGLDLRC